MFHGKWKFPGHLNINIPSYIKRCPCKLLLNYIYNVLKKISILNELLSFAKFKVTVTNDISNILNWNNVLVRLSIRKEIRKRNEEKINDQTASSLIYWLIPFFFKKDTYLLNDFFSTYLKLIFLRGCYVSLTAKFEMQFKNKSLLKSIKEKSPLFFMYTYIRSIYFFMCNHT